MASTIRSKVLNALWEYYNDLNFGEMREVAEAAEGAALKKAIEIRRKKKRVSNDEGRGGAVGGMWNTD